MEVDDKTKGRDTDILHCLLGFYVLPGIGTNYPVSTPLPGPF